jgi:hypothetical protein
MDLRTWSFGVHIHSHWPRHRIGVVALEHQQIQLYYLSIVARGDEFAFLSKSAGSHRNVGNSGISNDWRIIDKRTILEDKRTIDST